MAVAFWRLDDSSECFIDKNYAVIYGKRGPNNKATFKTYRISSLKNVHEKFTPFASFNVDKVVKAQFKNGLIVTAMEGGEIV